MDIKFTARHFKPTENLRDYAQDADDTAGAAPIHAGDAMKGSKSLRVKNEQLQVGLRRQFLFHMPSQRDKVGDVQCLLVCMQFFAPCRGLHHIELE